MRPSVSASITALTVCALGFAPVVQGGDSKRKVKTTYPPKSQITRVTTTRPASIQGNPIGPNLKAIYDRTGNHFKNALFYKPSERTGTETDRQFASLIVQEVSGTSGAPEHLHIGAAQKNASGDWSVDISRPTVYTAESHVMLGNLFCEQRIHVWAYPAADGKGAVWRGIRTTYGPTRYPLVWEFLNTEGQPIVMFVSRTFEKAAEKQYGKPLPGRRASAEPSLEEQPNLLVARLLPDGAQPMGPMVYIETSQTPTTALCRCMDSQVSNFVENNYYEMLPLDILGEVQIAPDGPFRLAMSAVPPTSTNERPWIERALRTSKRF